MHGSLIITLIFLTISSGCTSMRCCGERIEPRADPPRGAAPTQPDQLPKLDSNDTHIDASLSSGGNSRSPIGTNLDGVRDWSTELAFVDAFKASRAWISSTETNWDDPRPLKLDARGWPSSLEPGQFARTLMLWDHTHYRWGSFTILWEGDGEVVALNGRLERLKPRDVSPRRVVVPLEPNRDGPGFEVMITRTNPKDPVRNLRVLMPGGACDNDGARFCDVKTACSAGARCVPFEENYSKQIFYPDFLATLKRYSVLRFMDWMQTNNSKESRWSERPEVGDARWSLKGVPLEIMIELANRLHAEPWFNIPHLAEDDYVRNFARTTQQGLDPSLRAWVELSNEVWNSMFTQWTWARERGFKAGEKDATRAQFGFYVRRSTQVFKLWHEGFPDRKRQVRVIGTHAANTWLSEQQLDFEGTKKSADVLALAPYLSWFVGPAERARFESLTLDQMFEEADRRILPEAAQWMRDQARAARERGLGLVSYEGGQHFVAVAGVENDAKIVEKLIRMNRDPRMRPLYSKYLTAWKEAGGQLFVHFNHCSGPSKWGSWGSLEWLTQDPKSAPKFLALQDFIRDHPRWW